MIFAYKPIQSIAIFLFITLLFTNSVNAKNYEPSEIKLKVLYNSLDPYSIAQHLAFYELYSDKPLGQQALRDAWRLLSQDSTPYAILNSTSLLSSAIQSLVALVNKPIDQSPPKISHEDLAIIESLAKRLSHTQLKGHNATSEQEVLSLAPEEIDLARGLFLSQFGYDVVKIKSYEAMIDLMALQIAARLSKQATPEQKIQAINRFIFDDMGFRFPPHSIYAKDIDLYTFLPSVLDSHRGVCLGVSFLYLCIAQRLSLPLEMITPPGHIYIRYRNNNTTINIETTARGIHVDSDEYLSVDTKSLQQRNIKEVIGLAHTNQAAVFLQREKYNDALKSYLRAELYLPNDFLIKELMGYTYLFVGEKEKGEFLLNQVKDHIPDYSVTKRNIAEDYLQGHVDAEGIKVIFKSVDDDRASILEKKQSLEKTIQRYPRFRSGIQQLAVTWLQLHRMGEALEVLNYYHSIHADDPEINYYLAVIYATRLNYNKAWDHLHQAEAIVRRSNYAPKTLKDIRRGLIKCCPE